METASSFAYRCLFANDVPVLGNSLRIIYKVLKVTFRHSAFALILATTTSLLFLQIVANILKDPEEQQYRRLKFTNVTFRKTILEVPGALEFLKNNIGLSGFCRRMQSASF